jgi:hypothetical protein
MTVIHKYISTMTLLLELVTNTLMIGSSAITSKLIRIDSSCHFISSVFSLEDLDILYRVLVIIIRLLVIDLVDILSLMISIILFKI